MTLSRSLTFACVCLVAGLPVTGAHAQPAAQPTPPVTNPCEYIDAAEAAPLVGPDGTPTTAPSRGAFASCGYTSPSGDGITLYVADYGIPQVAQQFFERNRDALKTAVMDETYGVPAFTHRTAEQPFKVTFAAVKGVRMVTLEATGPLATSPQAAPHLRAILTKALAKLPADAPPPPPD